MPRAKQDDSTRTRPLTIPALREYGALDAFSAPGSFDPGGEWTHTYRIWLVGSRGRREMGSLRLERTAGGDAVVLDVAQSVKQATGSVHETNARIQCRPNQLCSPLSWRIESVLLDADGRPLETTRVEQTAAVHDGAIEIVHGDTSSVRKVPRAFTSNWSLFEAVQRLPGAKTRPLRFALLEDLDLLKKGQRLSFQETATFELGGKALRLDGYHQTGRGVLPYHYWVDEHRRLLVAISGIRAYILDSTA
ncbi:MAG: hypothetical protein ACE5R4_01695 [Armatimonadota bacterium]